MLEVENNAKLLTKDSLGVGELVTLFEYPNAIPFQPKGGEIFVYKISSGKKIDWKEDGHMYVAIFFIVFFFPLFKVQKCCLISAFASRLNIL